MTDADSSQRVIKRNPGPAVCWARAVTIDNLVFGAFILCIGWTPYWFGSHRPLAWGLNALIFGILAIVYESVLIVRGLHPTKEVRVFGGGDNSNMLRNIRLPIASVFIALGWAILQTVHWTPITWHHAIWDLASEALGHQVSGSISVDPDQTALAALRLLTSAAVFWLSLHLCRNAARARILIWSIVSIGVVYAIVGLYALRFLPGGTIFQEMVPAHFVSSTFVNKNSYATYAGVAIVAAVGLIQQIYRRAFKGGYGSISVETFLTATIERAIFPLLAALIMLAALFLTGSRGGTISTAAGLLVLLLLNRRNVAVISREELIISITLAAFLISVCIAFGSSFIASVASRGLSDDDRIARFIITIKSIINQPLLGHGYGTFSSIFPLFRDNSLSVWLYHDAAHNTFLEVWQGLGVVVGTLLIAGVGSLVFFCARAARTSAGDRTIPAIAASVSVLISVHALVDFSLQIQAVTLTYTALLGTGVARAFPAPVNSGVHGENSPSN